MNRSLLASLAAERAAARAEARAEGRVAEPTQAQIERARSRSVFIATPIARHPTHQYCTSLVTTMGHLTQLGIRLMVHSVVGSSNLAQARSALAAAFLASQATDMLFVDDDMGWNSGDVVRLLASDKAVIGGIGARKLPFHDADPRKWCYIPLAGPRNQDDEGAIEVASVGTGFSKITREPFLRMIAAHPEWKRRGLPGMPAAVCENYYRFYSFSADTFSEELGEDAAWCRDWRALGGKVWVDPKIRLVHVGQSEYTGDVGAMFR